MGTRFVGVVLLWLLLAASAHAQAGYKAVGSPQLTANDGQPSYTAVSPDGTLVAVVRDSQPSRLWLLRAADAASPSYDTGFAVLPGSPTVAGSLPNDIAFSPDGTLLAVANSGDGTVSVFHVDPTNPTQALTPVLGSPFAAGASPEAVTFSPDGKLLAVPSLSDDKLTLFTVSGTAVATAAGYPQTLTVPAQQLLLDAAFTPDGKDLAVGSGHAALGTTGTGYVSLLQVSGTTLTPVSGSPFAASTAVGRLAIDGPRSQLAALGPQGNLSLFTMQAGGLALTAASPIKLGSDTVSDIAYSLGGFALAVADTGAAATKLFTAGAGTLTPAGAIPTQPGFNPPQTVAWAPRPSPDGEVLFSSSGEFQAYSLGPFAAVTTPPDGASYVQGALVNASYGCAGLVPVTACTGPVADGAALDTTNPGASPFAVTATNADGVNAGATTHYTVTATPCDSGVRSGATFVSGCLHDAGDGRFTSSGAVRVNGIAVTPAAGQSLTVTKGTAQHPDGSLTGAGGSVSISGQELYHGAISLPLPGGGPNETRSGGSLATKGETLLGMPLTGTAAITYVDSAQDNLTARVAVTLALPTNLHTAAGTGGITAGGIVAIDADGTAHFEALKLSFTGLKLGTLAVDDVCYTVVSDASLGTCAAAAPAGVLNAPASNFRLSCQGDPGAGQHWVVAGRLELPTPRPALLALAGSGGADTVALGLSPGELLAPEVRLNRFTGGLCFGGAPEPPELGGDAALELDSTGSPLTLSGAMEFEAGTPWSLEASGSYQIHGEQAGSGLAGLNADGSVSLEAHLAAGTDAVQLQADDARGWFEGRHQTLGLAGDGTICGRVECAPDQTLFTSSALVGCADLGGFDAGVLHTWGQKTSNVMASACDVGAWAGSQPFTSGLTLHPDSHHGVVVRVIGKSQPPSVTVTAGSLQFVAGTDVAHGDGYLALPDPVARAVTVAVDTTHDVVLTSSDAVSYQPAPVAPPPAASGLVKPPQGGWDQIEATICGARDTTWSPTQAQNPDGLPSACSAKAGGAARPRRDGTVRVSFRHALPAGARLTLTELGKGVAHTFAVNPKLRACPQGRCATVALVPANGPGGRRRVVAALSLHGRPASLTTIGQLTAGGLRAPNAPSKVQLRRSGKIVVVSWTAGAAAARYGLDATTSTSAGTVFSKFLGGGCRGARLLDVPAGAAVTVGVSAIRGDGAASRPHRVTLKAGGKRGGAKGKVLKGHRCG